MENKTQPPPFYDAMFPDPEPVETPVATKMRRRKSLAAPNIRPPTMMIDLLFGALMLFAFQMGDPSNRSLVSQDFELPTSSGKQNQKPKKLVPITPHRINKTEWVYELPSGKRLSASAVLKFIGETNQTPVLLVPSSASVQRYIDAEQPLRKLGIKVGLAVSIKKGNSK